VTSVSAIRGTCLCGSVQWQAEVPFFNVSHCHCSMCRKAHGAAFATYVGARAEGFCFVAGKDAIARFRSSNQLERCFCARCGSVVPDAPKGGSVYMPLGGLNADPGVRSAIHLFVADKAPWYAITDGAPQHASYPEAWNVGSIEPVTRPYAADPSPRDDGSATGSCLCGRVAYALAPGPALSLYNCHCTRCRKARAAAHATNTFVARERFSWLCGEDLLAAFKVPEAERFTQAFCTRCGSGMPVVRSDRAVIPAATLDTPIVPADQRHIFVASKASWFEITDALPQHAAYPQ
jgi:hypothetical protein